MQAHTHTIFNTYCLSTATVFMRTLLNATFYIHCLSYVFMAWLLAIDITTFLRTIAVKPRSVLCMFTVHYRSEILEGICSFQSTVEFWGASGDAIEWDTVLEAGRLRVRFLMVSLEFFIDMILPGVDTASDRINTRNIYLGVKAYNITAFMCRLS